MDDLVQQEHDMWGTSPVMENGVWVVFIYDMHPIVKSIWDDELEARRQADALGGGYDVSYVRLGFDFNSEVSK